MQPLYQQDVLMVWQMYDNFRSPGYIDDVAALFPRDVPDQQWRVMHVQLSSAGRAFGLFNLDRDVSSDHVWHAEQDSLNMARAVLC